MMNEEKEVKTGCWGKEGEVNKDGESEEKKKEREIGWDTGEMGDLMPLCLTPLLFLYRVTSCTAVIRLRSLRMWSYLVPFTSTRRSKSQPLITAAEFENASGRCSAYARPVYGAVSLLL